MGNYHSLEKEFIERTIRLIDQYYAALDNYPFEEQFNYTLTINCLLGLIVMPNERAITYIPNPRLTGELRSEIGLAASQFGDHITTLRDLISELRNSIAHFDIKVVSENPEHRIDWVEFRDSQQEERLVANFRATELLPFLRFYASCLIENLTRHKK